MYKEKNCQMDGCENIFIPTSGSQKYCLDCKEKAKRLKEKEQWKKVNRKKYNKEYIRNCLACGNEFSTYYKKKVYCGNLDCEKERVKRKNVNSHKRRDRNELIEKGRKYYKNNREKCLLKRAEVYRKLNPNAKEYVSGKTNKHTIEYIRNYIEERGYILLSKEYINSKLPIILKCPKGHEWTTTFHNFRDLKNKTGVRCMTCYLQNNYTSRFELEVREFVNSIYHGKVVYNDRTIVFNKNTGKFLELDLYLPDLNKAIECDGVYWHQKEVTIKNDNIKTKFCKNNRIELLRVSDIEWNDSIGKLSVNNFLLRGNNMNRSKNRKDGSGKGVSGGRNQNNRPCKKGGKGRGNGGGVGNGSGRFK